MGRPGLSEQAFVIKAILRSQGRAQQFRWDVREVREGKRSGSSEKARAPQRDGSWPEEGRSGHRAPHRVCERSTRAEKP